MRKSELSIKELQEEEYRLLGQLADYCDSNGLSYYLAYGTLLGAVRHGGPIPWDDDLDIVLPRKDYDALLKQAPVLDRCRLLVPGTEGYPWAYAKFSSEIVGFREPAIRHLPNHGAFIDVFPLDALPNTGAYRAMAISHALQKCRNYAYIWDWSCESIRKGAKGILKRTLGVACRLVPLQTWDKWVQASARTGDWNNCDYVACYFTLNGINKEKMPKEECNGFSEVVYKDRTFKTFPHPISAIERVYGHNWKMPIRQIEHIHGYAFRRE